MRRRRHGSARITIPLALSAALVSYASPARAAEPSSTTSDADAAAFELPPPRETLPGMYPENLGATKGRGFIADTPDRSFVLRVNGFAHLDTRFGTDPSTDPPEQNLFWRRARMTIDGRMFGPFEFRAMWDHMIDPIRPYDFHLDYRPLHEFNVRVGGFKSPFGLERRARSYALPTIERAFPTSLAPNRELGVFVYGQTQDGFLSWEGALVNGTENLGVRLFDVDEHPDFSGRVWVQPFRLTPHLKELKNLGVGFSWTVGNEFGDEDTPRIGNIRATARRSVYGGRRLFTHLSDERGTTVADGLRDRQGIQAYWQHRQAFALFEYVRSSQQVSRGIGFDGYPLEQARLAHHGWQVVASLSLDPDDENTFFGVYPSKPFDPSKGHYGGATVSLRYQELYMDPDAFPRFADPSASVRGARAVAASLQWHFNYLFEPQLDVEYMVPRGGAPGGADMPPELTVQTRLEVRY